MNARDELLDALAGSPEVRLGEAEQRVDALVVEVRAAALNEGADEVIASCPDHGPREEAWMECHCDVADELRRMATTGQTPTPAVCDLPHATIAEEKACDQQQHPSGYPAVLPWAAKLDADDLEGFLGELSDAAFGNDDLRTLGEVESVIARWRAIAEAEQAMLTAPGPDPSPTVLGCTCGPDAKAPCGHCTNCDQCLDCGHCSGTGCTCECGKAS